MDNVFVVVYQEWDYFEVREVFKTRQSALNYIEDDADILFKIDKFIILEKKLWE